MSSNTSDRSLNRPGLVIPDANFNSIRLGRLRYLIPSFSMLDGPGSGKATRLLLAVSRIVSGGQELNPNSKFRIS
jgi:hypothetical protein